MAIVWVASLQVAIGGSNTVPMSRSGSVTRSVTADALKPSQCTLIALTQLIAGSGTVTGSSSSDLVLGSWLADGINAGGGDDCIVGGGGNDVINGGAGTDWCIGGPGVDSFISCEHEVQ